MLNCPIGVTAAKTGGKSGVGCRVAVMHAGEAVLNEETEGSQSCH